MIKFKLKNIEKIAPFGNKENLSLHWFGLSDGQLWFEFQNSTVFEYSKEALDCWNIKASNYVDYYISRFSEDMLDVYINTLESIPSELYKQTINLTEYLEHSKRWFEKNNSDEEVYHKYELALSWITKRQLSNGHLKGGPTIWFFRHNDIVKIIWEATAKINDTIPIWKSINGSIEMDFEDFKKHIKEFYSSYFESMKNQIDRASKYDFGSINVDKKMLYIEHERRKSDWLKAFNNKNASQTNWAEIIALNKILNNE